MQHTDFPFSSTHAKFGKSRRWVKLALVAFTLCAMTILTGCDLPERPKLKSVAPPKLGEPETPEAQTELVQVEPPTALEESTWETWDAYFINNKHVGYSHVKSSETSTAVVGGIRFDLDHRVYSDEGNARVLQRLVLACDESNGGRLVEFEGSMQVGLQVTTTSGKVQDSNLVIEMRDGRNTTRREIPWDLNYRGMFAVEQSLRANPMRVDGDVRVLKMLISGRYELATASLRCSGNAVVPMLDGTDRELTEINVQLDVGETEPIYSTIWIDEQGDVVRTYSPALNMIGYRTDEATATAIPNDDLVPISVAVTGEMDRPRDTKRVAYRINNVAGSTAKSPLLLLPGPGQFVRGTPTGETQVLVSRQQEDPSGGFVADEPSPEREDLRPNFFIDSQSDLVKKFADAAIDNRKLSELEVARELTGTANRMVNVNPESCGLAKASVIARVAEGDSTQCAILLAALLRAQKIPSRIAIGLRFEPGSEIGDGPSQMVAHVWTIAYVGDRWVHLDATEGDQAAADRLLLKTTNLSESTENDSFSAMLGDAGRMEIEILTAKY